MCPLLAAGVNCPALDLNWTVEVEDGDQPLDLTDARAVVDQVGSQNVSLSGTLRGHMMHLSLIP